MAIVMSDPDTLTDLSNGVNFIWLLFCGALVFYMQAGFAMLEAGSVRVKNTRDLMLKCTLDNCISMLGWWVVGWAIAFGLPEHPDADFKVGKFNGSHGFVLSQGSDEYALFFYQWVFAAATATIVSGAIAERATLLGYLIHVSFLSAVIYPFIAHWAWGGGWLATHRSNGYLDFAGSGVVHLTGGVCSIFGAFILGPRYGRFGSDGKPKVIPGYSTTLIALGSFLLMFGWFGFNMGGTITFVGKGQVAARAGINTLLSGASGGIVGVILSFIISRRYDIVWILNCLLAGMVSITGSCAYIDFWAAPIYGLASSCWYSLLSWVWIKLRIDDPVDAGPLHAGCGLLGTVMLGLFGDKDIMEKALGTPVHAYGLFLGGGWEQLGVQFIGVSSIIAWTSVLSGGCFLLLKVTKLLRISKTDEMKNVDGKQKYVDAWARVQIMDGGRLEEFQFRIDSGPTAPQGFTDSGSAQNKSTSSKSNNNNK